MKKVKKIRRPRKLPRAAKVVIALILILIAPISFHFFRMVFVLNLNLSEAYQNLANPYVRIVRITPGMRREQVADRFAQTLGWTPEEKNRLINIYTLKMGSGEGYYYPTTYVIPAHANAQDVSDKLEETFTKEIIEKQEKLNKNILNTETIIKIASIIEREAAGPQDMHIVSGVIWNRLFKGMTLDIDATLQYAKGSEERWWPIVRPEDKYIKSEYNTYKNKGLPPSAISNPSKAAINAALNPAQTKAIFYIHDHNRQIHTAETYQQHLNNINRYF